MVTDFKWHLTKDGLPEIGKNYCVLLGKRGGIYVGKLREIARGRVVFYIPNNRESYMEISSVEAWMEIPPFEVGNG